MSRLGRFWLAWLAAAVGLVLAAGAGVVAPRIVARKAMSVAAERGVALTVGKARVGWLTATLEDVTVELDGVRGLHARFSQVEVAVDWRVRPRRLAGHRGKVDGDDLRQIALDLQQWRAARRQPSTPGNGPGLAVELDLDEVHLGASGGPSVGARGVRVVRHGDELEATAAAADATASTVTVSVEDGSVKLGGAELGLRSAHAGAANVAWKVPVDVEDGGKPATHDGVPDGRDDDPPPTKKKKGGRRAEPPLVVARVVPDLHGLRAAIDAGAQSMARYLPEGVDVGVDALSLRVQHRDGDLTIGSGHLRVERDPRRIEVTFATSPMAHATPLALKLDLPTVPDDVQLSVSGGPVPLGLLGMRDGGLLHLLEVDRASFGGKARVVLDDRGQTLTFDVQGAAKDLSTDEARLAHEPVRGLNVGVSARGVLDDKGELRLDDAEGSIGAARVLLHGGLSQTDKRLATAIDFEFPTASCASLLTSIPRALVPTVADAMLDGTLTLHGRLVVDTANLDAMVFDYDVRDLCRFVEAPRGIEPEKYRGSFGYVAYTKTGEREDLVSGPGTPSWSEIDEISPFMQVAVLVTEDGAFFHHHGFNHAAIRHAVTADIRAGRFVRGASTITMQLAKNLFLSREKTLARKLEELILADYLEQSFTKDEMMELYLNIIEFGPDVYGVTAAADHYFGRQPRELDLAECLFLSSILPNPIAYHKAYDDGHLSDRWMQIIYSRMAIASKVGLISQAELAEGLKETVVFHRPSDPPPAPRAAPTSTSRPGRAAEIDEPQ